MNILNALSFLTFGLIMRFLPVLVPTFVAPDALNAAAAEATTRGTLLVAAGYAFGALGAWLLIRKITRITKHAAAEVRRELQAARETCETADERNPCARGLAGQVEVHVQY
ncbi:flagellar biosynthesis/type III secretory pathway M-ring protein FliF/YscJ [Ereboglobus sp. PH5-5]|uniref:hypothetical protein n=1 Tax=unclassified Ereboglobus TaxID=2626932 RepID=UPI002405146F|nr:MULTISPECIES: hypothetical protein [unclassified Ereboglobus]MDF9827897.1 flagellar biosynthesis/type III secretory pathway M-ring protein FliF/YscJ [Ereboglobus sp. PH5-10]MDF9833479.1 flagellar biosynthesis/type III secretory pathway M-ring protein FliF/YscJ [Ereboglobus sp. PH5-5]